MKKVIFNESRESVRKGLNITCDAIKQTIGPRGRNAFIDNEMQPFVTNDGVSIANAIKLEGFEEMGAWLTKNTCGKTFDDVGDATTTTAVLLQAIIDESLVRPENPIKIRASLKLAAQKVIEMISKQAKPIKESQIQEVATVAAESETVGKLIGEVLAGAGKKTPIYIEEDYGSAEVSFAVVEGLETRNGYISSHNPVIELGEAPIFVTDKRIDSLMGIKELLTLFEQENITTPIIICPDIDELVYKFFMKLNEKGAFNYVVVRAKGNDLYDMAAVSGATVISTTTGLDFKDVKIEHLGLAKKIVITDKKTLITAENTPVRVQYIEKLTTQAKNTKNQFEAQALNRRAEALTGGIAMIKVGAPTDTERTDLKLKILNAVNTTKTALEEGVVEGGAMCLYRISTKLKGKTIGEEILKRALKQPLKEIIKNAGEDYADIAKRITKTKGYNADTNKIEDLVKNGVIDSAKSTRCAFTNALSTASEYITVGVAITEDITHKVYETTRK